MTIKLAKLAIETCLFPLWECEAGEYRVSTPSMRYVKRPEKKKPVEEYLKLQGRFRHLFNPKRVDIIEDIQEHLDREWKLILKRADLTS